MAAISWAIGTSGTWTNAAEWSTDAVPGAAEARGGTLSMMGTISGAGSLLVNHGATLQLGTVNAGAIAGFVGSHRGVLALTPRTFLGKIAGFANGATIDLLKTSTNTPMGSLEGVIDFRSLDAPSGK